jgi:hypothetical protein
MGELNRNRLASILGMLGSNEEGERTSAANLAHQMVRDAGQTWQEVLDEGVADALRHEIERYREDVDRLERALEAERRQVRGLKDQLERTRAPVRSERPTWREQQAALRNDASSAGPRNQPAGWGPDPFGEKPALTPIKPTNAATTIVIGLLFGVVIIGVILVLVAVG